ncbi:AMP-binding protein [Rhodococcus spelaei]|uniref:AMP-binding protein n=1 Tax=Rhodococcus spelaei TaxID=2546320 RepID=A0A541B3Z3_9NOCA|nr:AMP-binding protein [Rhodococcus spelaei]TQF67037.1 AMP-binding protein [Rhodococcus spelaei]
MTARTLLHRARNEAIAARTLRRAGMIRGTPRALVVGVAAVARLGPFGGLPAYCTAVHRGAVAIVDDRGAVTFDEFAARTHRLANALRAALSSEGTQPSIGILCRNHADALVTLCAAAAAGARVVLLGADFGPTQVEVVAARERLDAIVYDQEFAAAVAGFDGRRWCAWYDGAIPPDALERLVEQGAATAPPRPEHAASLVILTSGSSGMPKGAPRAEPRTLMLTAGLLERIPLRGGERVLLSAPVFHGWGLLVAMLTLMLGSTLVLHRRFDATRALTALTQQRCAAFIAVPTMIRRMLDLGDAVDAADLSALRIVASGGARLEGALVTHAADVFGPVLHNLYGSTEAAYISIATPTDLADAPDCAGRPTLGTVVRIADGRGRSEPVGIEGRILVRTPAQIEAYTDGTTRSGADGFLDTGDRGHLDARGRLHVSGRSDSMIVSGGENVFPEEVELVLLTHPAIADAAVTPVDDEEFGQRLRAYVVRGTGSLDEGAVRAHVAAELPRSRMPRDIVFVDALPRGASGKVLRHTLDELKESHA